MPDFLIYAYAAGILVALIAGPLGVFVAWQRLSFFGHTLAHSALIGVAMALFLDVEILWGVTFVSVMFSCLLSMLYARKSLSRDTWMALLAHGSLGVSLVFISFFPEAQRYVLTYLFGDILALTLDDVVILGLTGIFAFVSLYFLWNPLLRLTIHEGIARVEGVPVFLIRTLFMVLVALVISVSLKVLGGLLITAMLILPAATARRMVFSPEQMAIGASLIGLFAVFIGLTTAQALDSPPAASIVVASLGLFFISRLIIWRRDF